MRISRLASVVLFVSASAAMTASAQTRVSPSSNQTGPVHQGFFISAGLGYGSAAVKCDGCSTDRVGGLSGYLRLGGTVSPHIRLGVESNGWVKTVDGIDEQIGFLSAMIYLYPSATNNFWIKAGAGYTASKESDSQDEVKTSGAGVSAGIGYDWAIGGGGFVLSPYAGYLRQLSGKIKVDGEDTGVSSKTDLLQVGLGLGFRH